MAGPPANAIHEGLGRLELFDLAPEWLPLLRESLARSDRPFSIHAPLCRRPEFPHPAVAVFFLSPDSARREESFAHVEATLAQAKEWGGEYVVTHLNWVEDTEDEAEASRLAQAAAERLSGLAERHGVPLHIECGGYAGGFHGAEQFAALPGRLPGLGLCLDMGHLWLIARARRRSFYRDLEVLAPHARSMHLWNTRDFAHYQRHHHVPVHPSQRPEDGWIDLERALGLVLDRNPDCALIFEYTWSPSEEEWVREGMAWVASLAGRDPRRQSRFSRVAETFMRAGPPGQPTGRVCSLHITGAASEPMLTVPEVRAVPGNGLEGDRYFLGTGIYSNKPGPDREVTLIEMEVLWALDRDHGIRLTPHESRRNIVTAGVALRRLVGREFAVGGVRLRGIRLCEPCAHLERLTVPGVLAALVHRGGLRAQILTEGMIRVGDSIEPLV